ncbi:PEGA domain-containing protein [Candidatus Spyradosoma sp. SGI.093]|uniref:PEGA domain-containing protein n=1 Tax=Candidatus Spyradosoma sp. SGI.093 TaxID=3420583 RepID=UPI003D028492
MKYAFCICAVLFACLFSGCLLRDSFDNEKSSYLIDEKSSYLIDSNPRGLRVTIDDIELGITPCKYEFSNQTPVSSISWVKVYPPTKQQLKTYSEENLFVPHNSPNENYPFLSAQKRNVVFPIHRK